ncbi:SDR family NAD(P)-dependent oxidoreductase, partial [Salmonella enterica]|uniref:SDR family NAD(P)-dependent oxidoreductase n=1 Tax=Salmonella enterica TaxID=28901 RepID=UPI0020C517F8
EILNRFIMALLDGKVAFVSGGGSGIGRAVAEAYAKEGAKVVIADINALHGAKTVQAITDAGGEAFFIAGDSSKAEDNRRFVAETVARFGRL